MSPFFQLDAFLSCNNSTHLWPFPCDSQCTPWGMHAFLPIDLGFGYVTCSGNWKLAVVACVHLRIEESLPTLATAKFPNHKKGSYQGKAPFYPGPTMERALKEPPSIHSPCSCHLIWARNESLVFLSHWDMRLLASPPWVSRSKFWNVGRIKLIR